MFGSLGRTIGTTWRIMKDSAKVLQQDKELLAFPVIGFITGIVVIIIGAVLALVVVGGAAILDETETLSAGAGALAIVIFIVTYLTVTFVFTFFNAALVAGALERIRGGDPTIGSSLSKANSRFLALLGWALIAGTVSLIASAARSRAQERGGVGGVIAAIGISALVAIWEFITFFTVPVIIAEGEGSIGSIRRSYGIVKRTWGKQLVANFGFGFFYFIAVIPGLLIGGLVFLANPIAGGIVGGLLILIGTGLIHSLASVFKAVLYNYAVMGDAPMPKPATGSEDAPDAGPTPQYETFSPDFLRSAYTQKN